VEAHPDDRAAIALVATIDELFVIDAQAQKQNLTVIERDQSWNRSRGPLTKRIIKHVKAFCG
jgi:hypothetical protein